MKNILIIGYGNIDRQDDGAAWHVLNGIAQKYTRTSIETGEIIRLGENAPDILFIPQLIPELVEDLKNYQALCFVDAHTGAFKEDIRITKLEPSLQTSAFTHHMTPNTLLALLEMLHQQKAIGILVSVKGFEFEFEQKLSHETQKLIEPTVNLILEWIKKI